MCLRRGAAVNVERDAEVGKAVLYHRVVAVYHLLGRYALLLGTDGDWHTVLIASADELYVLFFQS